MVFPLFASGKLLGYQSAPDLVGLLDVDPSGADHLALSFSSEDAVPDLHAPHILKFFIAPRVGLGRI